MFPNDVNSSKEGQIKIPGSLLREVRATGLWLLWSVHELIDYVYRLTTSQPFYYLFCLGVVNAVVQNLPTFLPPPESLDANK